MLITDYYSIEGHAIAGLGDHLGRLQTAIEPGRPTNQHQFLMDSYSRAAINVSISRDDWFLQTDHTAANRSITAVA